ncbi:MAG: GtrA family protein [Clostridia bacterium]|nr:GtrA family protein [Clostridia bacterium]MBQ3057530.1 GtrA family protein [Clostridia bacterium]
MNNLFEKYKEQILYIIFGAATTLVNIIAYFLLSKLPLGTAIATILAWLISVIFAFFTNRKYVFKASKSGFLKQFFGFFSMRVLTGALDVFIMILFVDVLEFNDLFIKILSNILVIILNYVFSKLFVFKKTK